MSYLSRPVRLFAFILFISTSASTTISAQTPQTSVKTIISKIDEYNSKLPAEKLYLQFDKPYYAVGDTIWFKGYILNQGLGYSPQSSRVYIDLVNDSSVVVKRYAFAAAIGVTWGNIALTPSLFHEGGYTIRAYTNWMRNFGEESFFYKSFYLADALSDTWIIGADAKLADETKNNIEAKLKFTGLDRQPIDNQSLDIRLVSGKKTLFRNTLQTGDDGILDANFNLREAGQVKNLTVVATDKKDNKKKAIIPIRLNRAQDIDLQFMPEGGQIVASLPANIGIKAIGEDGRGINVKGVITAKLSGDTVGFSTWHKGMGTVNIVAQPGEAYTATITLPNGSTKTVDLPLVKRSGTVLKVKDPPNRDSIFVSMLATSDLVGLDKTYHFIAQSRGTVCYGASFNFKDSPSASTQIPKSVFPTGIVHLTLLNDQNQPMNERLIFIDHNDNLKIDIKTEQRYAPRDSIPMFLRVTDATGKPVLGSFSVAVTDNAQIKHDPDNSANILTDMLLSSDLKGYVEDPSYYFAHTDQSAKALDALLLTQGWIGYEWTTIIIGSEKITYDAEPEFTVKGKVSNLFGKPIPNSSVLLMSNGKYKMIRDTDVKADGRFVFDRLPLIMDSTKFVLTAHTKKGRTINGGITVDEPTLAPVVTLYNTPVSPWYVDADSTLLNYVKTNHTYQFELDKLESAANGHLLKSVNIRDRYGVKNSLNLNGMGNADQVLTTADMDAAGRATLLEVIEKKVKGFRTGYIGRSTSLSFLIKDKRVHFVIDGVDMDRFYQSSGLGNTIPNEHYDYQKGNLEYLTAEDILGIEVLYSSKYTGNYSNRNLTSRQILAQNPAGPVGSEVAFIEVTTRSGNGLFMKKTGGVYVYKPMPVSIPREFYNPRYTAKNIHSSFNDLRSTVYWKQSIVTNKQGEATLSFYAADKPTTYTIILEGGDLNGKIGYQTGQISIKGAK